MAIQRHRGHGFRSLYKGQMVSESTSSVDSAFQISQTKPIGKLSRRLMVTGKLGIGAFSQIPRDSVIFSDDGWGVQSPPQQGT